MTCTISPAQHEQFNRDWLHTGIEEENGVCNISVTSTSNEQVQGSPTKRGFLNNLIRKKSKASKESTESKDKESKNAWSNIFRKSSPDRTQPQKEDEEMAKFIEGLQLEGRSEAEINMHLSYIHQLQSTPQSPSSAKGNSVFQWLRDMQQAIKDEFSFKQEYYYPEPSFDRQGMTVSISTAPFFGALPPNMDMTYEELAALEPVYVGSKCINNLPICKYDGTPLPGDQTTCTVCLGEFTKGEKLKSLPCVHFFHKECIDSWLMVGHTCPVCKALVE